MTNSYYNHSSGQPVSASLGRAITIRAELDLIEDGFDAVDTALDLLAPKADADFSTDITVNGVQLGRGFNDIGSNLVFGSGGLGSATGANNISIGNGALVNLTTGEQNIAIGQSAIATNVVRSGNTAVGYYALSGCEGQGNSAFGAFALGNSTGAAQRNAAVGELAGYYVTGSFNAAMGYSALSGLAMAGSWNVAVGSQSLVANTASNNTAVGGEAGSSNTTGQNNTFVGYQADGASATASNVVTLGNASVAALRCQVTSITALSDARDKTAISDLSFGLDFVASLRPVAFTWNTRDGSKVGIRSSGFLAQELKAAQDRAGAADVLGLVYEENPEKLEAAYGHLIPVLVKAVQELKSEVDALRSQLIG